MKIRPLTNQVLVRLLPPDFWNPTGLLIPESAQAAPQGEKAYPRKAVVVEIGPWRTVKSGHAVLPEIHKGQTVFVNEYRSVKLRDVTTDLRLVKQGDILAVMET